jgi:hypothetical protein
MLSLLAMHLFVCFLAAVACLYAGLDDFVNSSERMGSMTVTLSANHS